MAIETSGVSSVGGHEPRTSFSLMTSQAVWVVRSGALDVFVTRVTQAGDDAALRPLFRVSAGQGVFGIGGGQAGIKLVAKRSQESEVLTLSLTSLADIDAALDRKGGGLTLLGEWIASLSQAAGGNLMPKTVEWLERGAHIAAQNEGRALSSKESLSWISQSGGSSRFLGRSDVVIATGTPPFPLSHTSWVELQPNSELQALDALASPDGDSLLSALDAFYRHVLACVLGRIDDADLRERGRLRVRAEGDERSVAAALQDLASPLKRRADRSDAGIPHGFDTPLMRACEAIGKQLGVTMRPHPDLVHGRPVKEPVASIADASGIRYRRVALKDNWMKRGSEPLLVFRDADQKPAALLRRRGSGYAIYDPELGTATPLTVSTAATLNPFAFMFYRPFEQKPISVRDLLTFGLKDGRRDLLFIVALSSVTAGLALLFPYLTGVIFESTIPNAQRSELVTITALLVVAALVTTLFNVARSFVVLRLQGKLSVSLQAALWDRLLSLPLPFFRQFAAGDLAQRSTAFSQIRVVLTGSVLGALLSGIFSVSSFALLFYYSPRLAFVATLMTLVALIFTVVAGMMQLNLLRRSFKTLGLIAGMVVEFISGIAKFRIAGAEQRAFVLWVKEFAKQKRADFDARQVSTIVSTFDAVYIVACTAVLFLVNSGMAPSGQTTESTLSTGEFLAFMAAFGQFMASALSMGSAFIGMSAIVPLYERAAPILRTLPESLATQAAPAELTGEVEASHLIFRYHADSPLVLRDVSFHIRSGEFIAFVGPSGCGKSTLFRLLLGFEAPVSGSVYYDGADLAGLDPRAVRRQIGVVLQSGTLLGGSIWENICGATWRPMEEVWEAARMAGIDEDIKNMPMGMQTVLQSGGGGVSGGQRQRILIARAIVARPRLLLFDEATSALDNRTQAVVSDSLMTLKTTRIVIAHRLSTILGVDRIYAMDHGQIVQSGTYEELIKQPGLFRELAARQLT